VFNVAGKNIAAIKSGDYFTAVWSPEISEFFSDYILIATDVTSAGVSADVKHSFYLNCSGTCSNQLSLLLGSRLFRL
jgi:hypothetical protein